MATLTVIVNAVLEGRTARSMKNSLTRPPEPQNSTEVAMMRRIDGFLTPEDLYPDYDYLNAIHALFPGDVQLGADLGRY